MAWSHQERRATLAGRLRSLAETYLPSNLLGAAPDGSRQVRTAGFLQFTEPEMCTEGQILRESGYALGHPAAVELEVKKRKEGRKSGVSQRAFQMGRVNQTLQWKRTS